MRETISNIFNILLEFKGESMYLAVFVLALVYLFATEKEKTKKIVFIYSSLFIIGIFVFPFTAHIIMNKLMDREIYYRQLWLLPCGITVAFAGTRIIERAGERFRNGKKALLYFHKGICAVLIAGIIICGGNFALSKDNFRKADNAYHLPDYVINVCDIILEVDHVGPGEQSFTAAFPATLCMFTREYMTGVFTKYGRDALVERWVENWNMGSEVLDYLEGESYSAKELVDVCRNGGVELVVVYSFKEMRGNVEDYGFVKIGSTDGYDLYEEKWLAQFQGRI